MQPSFVGHQRATIVRRLVAAFDDLTATHEASVICITGGMGWGKTRLVQEFYRELAATRQPLGPYWPATLLDPDEQASLELQRTTLFPRSVVVPPGTEIPGMWWVLTCDQRDGRHRVPAVRTAAEQLERHVEPLAGRLAARDDLAKESLAMLGELVGLLVPEPVRLINAARRLVGALGRHLLAGMAEGKASRTIEIGEDVEDTLVDATVSALRGTFAETPLVVVIDDAHWADPSTVQLVEQLAASSAPVLVIALAWPQELRRQARLPDEGLHFGSWLATATAARSNVQRWDLQPLTRDDLRQMVLSVAPATSDATVRELCRRADRNPLALQLILNSDIVRAAITDEAIELKPDEIEAIPTTIWEHFVRRFHSLPQEVRQVAVTAADQGPRFLRGPVLAAAGAALGRDATRGFAQAVSPVAWLQHDAQTVFRFSEQVLFEISEAELQATFSQRHLDDARAAACRAVRQLKEDPNWASLPHFVRWEALRLHVRLAELGHEEDRCSAADSADQLAELARRDFLAERAASLARRAVRWVSEDGRPCDVALDLRCRLTLARTHVAQGRRDDAAAIRRTVLDRAQEELPDGHPLTLLAQQELARTLSAGSRQRRREGLDLRASIVGRLSQERTIDDPAVVFAKQELGMSLSSVGDHEAALAVREEVVALLDADGTAAYDPDAARALTNLAFTYSQLGRHDEALAIRRRVVDLRRTHFGDNHPALAGSLVNLAATLRSPPPEATYRERRAWIDEAVQLAEQAVRIRTLVFGRDANQTLKAWSSLSAALLASWELSLEVGAGAQREPELARANELIEFVAEKRRTSLGPTHKRTLIAYERWAEILAARGSVPDALAVAAIALDGARATLEPGHSLLRKIEQRYGTLIDDDRAR